MGGDYSSFEVLNYGHSDKDGSKSHLNLTYQENCVNAYMLVYVRDQDIPTVMGDYEIPENIGEIFYGEDKKRELIRQEHMIWECNSDFYSCHLMTEETILHHNWNGPMIA